MALLCTLSDAVIAADLIVEVHGVKPRKGTIRAALFNNAEAFAGAVKVRAVISSGGEITTGVFTREGDFAKDPVDSVMVPAAGRSVTLRFTDLPPGEYALGLYQDLNNDERLDIDLGGHALEPWGVSNDAGTLGEDPRWEDAKFSLPPEGRAMAVHLLEQKKRE